MKISKAQRTALQIINDNPGNVIAWQRLEGLKMLRIHGNTEGSIRMAGLATTREVTLARPVYFRHQGDTHAVTKVEVWELTDKGRDAIAGKPSKSDDDYEVTLPAALADAMSDGDAFDDLVTTPGRRGSLRIRGSLEAIRQLRDRFWGFESGQGFECTEAEKAAYRRFDKSVRAL